MDLSIFIYSMLISIFMFLGIFTFIFIYNSILIKGFVTTIPS